LYSLGAKFIQEQGESGMKNIILGFLLLAVVGIGGAIIYLYTGYPEVGPPPEITIEGTEAQVKRGEYLAEHVAVCIDCHSTRDWTKFSGPIEPGTYGRGGDVFNEDMGMPGTFYAKNITPHNLNDWSDGEIYRTITTGVTKDGRPMFPVMPYPAYGKMDPDDVRAIIAYIRTLEPIDYKPPDSEANFPMNLILRTMPQPADPMERPSPEDSVDYGKYLTTIAGCAECHTPQNQGTDIEGMYLAGGFEFKGPFGTVRSSNITPHKQTGIGNLSKEKFVSRFKQYDVSIDSLADVKEGQFNTVMPWQMYAGMTEQDLEAIYTYLKTVDPVENSVTRFTPPSEQVVAN
jgi:mono/diheme cytochrome c family protein